MNRYIKKHIVVLLLLLLFFLFSFSSAVRESLTFDEIVYLQEGRNAVLFHTFNIDPYNPPLAREIGIFPYIFFKQFYGSETFMLNSFIYGRIPMILMGVSLLIAVYLFVKKYVGHSQALFATFLLTFEPNILANSHYITMDIGLTLIFFLSTILFLRCMENTTVKNIIFLSLAVGLGMAIKISFIPYFFISAFCISLIHFRLNVLKLLGKNWKKIAWMICLALFVVWSTYFFNWNVVIKQRADTSRVSAKITQFAKSHHMNFLAYSVSFLETQPFPLGDYVATLKNNALRSVHANTCFFFGKYYDSCRWYFMPVNLFIKLPIPLIVFLGTSLVLLFKQKRKNMTQGFMLVSIIVILFCSMLLRLNPLVRYILPLVPFVAIFAGSTLSFWMKTILRKIVFLLLIFWYLYGTLFSFPHFISYANELTFGQKQFFLTDSNMDWGRSLPDVAAFIQQNHAGIFAFSYFGRDNADRYGLLSDTPYGSYKAGEICEFHLIKNQKNAKEIVTLISVSNWSSCGYNTIPEYSKQKVKRIIGESVFVF